MMDEIARRNTLKGFLHSRNSVSLTHLRKLLRCASGTNEAVVKHNKISMQALKSVSLRIHGDINHLKLLCGPAQFPVCLREVCKGRWANIRTVGVTESERNYLSPVMAEAQFRAVRSLEQKIRCRPGRVK